MKRLPAYPKALPCVILAVDPASSSGWAVFVEGKPFLWGALRKTDQVGAISVVQDAANEATVSELPLVVIGEEWGKGGRRGMKQWQGLGASWGAWKSAALRLSASEPRMAQSRIMRVHTNTWRSMFGMTRLSSAQAKAAAVRLVRGRLGIELDADEHDVAEALLIGVWASKAGTVGTRLPKGVMVKAGLYRGSR